MKTPFTSLFLTFCLARSCAHMIDIYAQAPRAVYAEQNDAYSREEAEDMGISRGDMELIALVTMAEAEDESEYGLRLVIDTILNRVDNEHFPDTVSGVIYQPRQFMVMWNGRAEKCTVSDDILRLVEEEISERTDSDVIFFRESRYSDYGRPMFKHGCHYFSSYE